MTARNTLFFENRAWDKSGAIDTDGDNSEVTVEDSRFDGNHAGEGAGAIGHGSSGATFRLIRSLLNRNSSGGAGGGAIGNYGEMEIVNTVIWENTTSGVGGGIGNAGYMDISHSTIFFNDARLGGGIANGGDLEIKNSIVAANDTGGDCMFEDTEINFASFIGLGENLDTDGSCVALSAAFTQVTFADLDFVPDSEGEITTDSVAWDAVTDCTTVTAQAVTDDVDKISRPQFAACDIGAREVQDSPVAQPTPVPTLGAWSLGLLSLLLGALGAFRRKGQG